MRRNTTALILVLALAFLTLFLTSTNPASLASIALFIPFILLFFIFWSTAALLLRSFGIKLSKSSRLSLIIATIPTGLLVLQSIGQLSPWDIVMVAAFAIVAYFYASKLIASRQEET